jgi:succinate dehydrogenase / fumarate reductase cytochrome b subunit
LAHPPQGRRSSSIERAGPSLSAVEEPSMSDVAAASSAAAPAKDASFVLRKLHSLTGIVPIGAFLLFHLFENLKLGLSAEAYETSIRHLWEMAPRPVFYAIEVGAIFVPILFHSVYGFWIWYQGSSNAIAYGYRRNWMYALQRWSGLVAFAYMGLHIWQLRVFPEGHLALARPTPESLTTFEHVAHAITPAWSTVAYLVGGIAAAFHLGNGLYGFAYSWGLASGRSAQRKVEVAGYVLFVLLSAAVIYTVFTVRHLNAV